MARPSKLWQDDRGRWSSRINGQIHHFGHDKKGAQIAFYQALAEAHRIPHQDCPETCSGLIVRWLQIHRKPDHRYRIRDLQDFAGPTRLVDLRPGLLLDLYQHLRTKPVRRNDGRPARTLAAATVRDRIRTAAQCLRWACSRGWLSSDFPVPRMARPAMPARDLRPDELARVLADLPAAPARILAFIAATGCRPSEAIRLRWADVDFRTATCVLAAHKTAASGRPRTLYLTPPAIAILKAVPNDHTGHVFRSRLGSPYRAAGSLRSVLRRRGITGPYALRHTFAQIASEQLALQDLARLLGHQDTRTTERYFDVKDARARAIAAGLELPQLPPLPAPPRLRSASSKPARRRAPRRSRRGFSSSRQASA